MQINSSIIVPLFHSQNHLAAFFDEFFRSELDLSKVELIFVIDGCSQEYNFEPFLKDFALLSRVKVYRLLSNQGQYVATLFGLYHAKGKVLLTLDVDCYTILGFFKTFFERAQNTKFDVTYADLIYTNRSLLRQIGAFAFKFIFQLKVKFKVNNEGSSMRIIKRTFINSIPEEIYRKAYNFDVIMIRNTDKIGFVPFLIDGKNDKSSYTLSKLIGLLWSFLFVSKTQDLTDLEAECLLSQSD